MANKLAEETSPYLLQHKDNPVDWRPWGPEALGKAASEDKPIMLSIGYSACHWCHVMERESFEDEETASLINSSFVPIKVDREERPDVDDIYMEAVQGMTGQGGWPLTVFLDSEGVPFYGGTYFPPEPRHGLPSFRQVLEATAGAYETQREELREAAARIRESLGAVGMVEQSSQPLDQSIFDGAVSRLQGNFDQSNGGFGGAPKFPPASTLEFLLARGVTQPVQVTLDKMMHGGIYDQLGGGFARYSVDPNWLIPHFEKMLYDNALLARVYLHGWQVAGEERWLRVCTETLDWTLREMCGPEGGFYSALDADSEGEEGRFYVWDEDEMREALAECGHRRRCDRAGPRLLGRQRGRELRGQEHPPRAAGGERSAAGRAGRCPHRPLRLARQARPPRPRRQAALLLERADDRGARRRGSRARAPGVPRRGLGVRPLRLGVACGTPTVTCCAPGRAARRASTPTSRTTPSCSRRCCGSTRRRSRFAGSTPRARPPTR